MIWLVLTLLAILARAGLSIATKLLTTYVQVSPRTLTIMFLGTATVISLLVTPFIGGLDFSGSSQHYPAITTIILAQYFGNILFFKGQSELDAGMTQIIIASSLIWSTLFSMLFLHSRFSGLQFAGIALLFVAIIMAQYRKGNRRLEPAVLYILGSAAFFALFQVISANLSKQLNTGAYLIWAYAGTTILLALVRPHQVSREIKSLLPHLTHHMRYIVFSAAMSTGYFVFSYLAFQHTVHKGVVVVLLSSQVVVSVILGILFLRERAKVKQTVFAAVLAVVAGFAIKS